jgi:tRNA pseudouridine38-40 synthase
VPTYRLTLEYEGTRYHGWQEQQNARSVAGELRRAVEEALPAGNALQELGGSGRTDAGVHALAQTAHLRLARPLDAAALAAMRRAVNDRLPADIHVLGLAAAPAGFHSRHSAVARSYLYQISRRRTALAKRYVWWVKRPLDMERIAAAAARLPGRHDYRLFCERPAEQPSTVVVVDRAEVAEAGGLILVRLVASHFLWKMVRRVVGTLVQVGAGDLDPAALGAFLAAPVQGPQGPQGSPAAWTAPPSGLFLERVLYAGDPPLPPLAETGPAVQVTAPSPAT